MNYSNFEDEENPKEVAMYEKFFKQLKDGWDGCTFNKDFTVDLIEVTDPLAAELLKKLKIDKDHDFEKRTMVMAMKDGTGIKIQGPTAYDLLAEDLTSKSYLDGDTCADAFFDKPEEDTTATETEEPAGRRALRRRRRRN